MKTFIKIALLAVFIAGAVVSILVFSGTRIVEGVDISNITIQDSVYVNDIQSRIAQIDQDWMEDFNEVDDLIAVYRQNNLLSDDNDKLVKEALVEKTAEPFTRYVLNEYFQRSSWNAVDILSYNRFASKLLSYKSANGDLVAQDEIKRQLHTVHKTCENYSTAKNIVSVYRNNMQAKRMIETAQRLRGDSYLMHEVSVRNKLNAVARAIHDSHWNQIRDGIQNLSNYSDRYYGDMSKLSYMQSEERRISKLIDDYQAANFYPSRNLSGVNAMRSDLNDIMSDWRGEIGSSGGIY